jgi:hypothetical protein
MKDLVGKKVKGFKFEDKKYGGLSYINTMDHYVGQIGKLEAYYEKSNRFKVRFIDDFYSYPAELIEAHLVDKETLVEKQPKRYSIGERITFKSKESLPGKRYTFGGDCHHNYSAIVAEYICYDVDCYKIRVSFIHKAGNQGNYHMLESEFKEWDMLHGLPSEPIEYTKYTKTPVMEWDLIGLEEPTSTKAADVSLKRKPKKFMTSVVNTKNLTSKQLKTK